MLIPYFVFSLEAGANLQPPPNWMQPPQSLCWLPTSRVWSAVHLSHIALTSSAPHHTLGSPTEREKQRTRTGSSWYRCFPSAEVKKKTKQKGGIEVRRLLFGFRHIEAGRPTVLLPKKKKKLFVPFLFLAPPFSHHLKMSVFVTIIHWGDNHC